jgi:beta-xylosidase
MKIFMKMSSIKQNIGILMIAIVFIACSRQVKNIYIDENTSYKGVWVSDQGNGTYHNPVLHADYSDPDVIRVGSDFYMTASSFTCVPGLPVLHSFDLVNWSLISYALPVQYPREVYDNPQQGKGAWAPCIRHHKGKFYIYYSDPDFGIYMVKSKNPAGPWTEPLLVKPGKGIIDPSPLWDDDGKAYLVHAFAGSRAGIKSILVVCRMNENGTKVLDDGVIIFDGHDHHPTIEGPKFYKRNGYYYIFAPAGGVTYGWQAVLRSQNIYGPYQDKIVMDQGQTKINGPHQGAWVELSNSENWFIHFQDKGPFGRVVHLQPMQWKDDWPIIGIDKDGDGKGEPVLTYKKPDIGKKYPVNSPPESDEFNGNAPGLQWQWNANPQPYWAMAWPEKGFLRLYAVQTNENFRNLYLDCPNTLLQKFPAPSFTATTKLKFNARNINEKAGLLIMGRDYAYLGIKSENGQYIISQTLCYDADEGNTESEFPVIFKTDSSQFYLRVTVSDSALCTFSYSCDSVHYRNVGTTFKAREGGWIGAKMGLFIIKTLKTNDAGSIDVDWFRVERSGSDDWK